MRLLWELIREFKRHDAHWQRSFGEHWEIAVLVDGQVRDIRAVSADPTHTNRVIIEVE